MVEIEHILSDTKVYLGVTGFGREVRHKTTEEYRAKRMKGC